MSETQRSISREPAGLRAPASASAPATPALGDLDTQLMLQVRGGDVLAANALVRRNFDRVARYIMRVVRDARIVEDVSQEVFLQVLAHAESYQPSARFSTWLYRIATNAALNHVNRADVKRRVPMPDETVSEMPDRSESLPERRMNLDEMKGRISQALGELPINQRVALTLFEFEDFSYEQIASVLNITVEAVRSLLMRARTTLRRSLAGLI